MTTLESLKALAACKKDKGSIWFEPVHATEAYLQGELSELIRAIEELTGGIGPHKEGQIICNDCGAPYSEMGLDLVLPDQQWGKVFPEESGLLCANCICERAAKLGGTAILAWIDHIDWEKKPCPAILQKFPDIEER